MAFGPVQVLRGVDFDVRPGEIHAVVGENGAGKSTLMKILAGVLRPTAGEVIFEGEPAVFRSVADAERRGIMMVHQEFNLVPSLSVQQNFFLGRELRRGPFFDDRAMTLQTRAALERVGSTASPAARIADLPVSDRQMIEIAKMLSRRASVLILDEPTGVLARDEIRLLQTRLRELSAQGVAVIYISHKLDEVLALAHRVTVLRDGVRTLTQPAGTVTAGALVRHMVGREIEELFRPKDGIPVAPVPALEVAGFRVPGHIEEASFSLRRGEILGFAGLIGSGRTELWEGILGLRPADAGTLRRDGKLLRFRGYDDALTRGRMAYLTEDRKEKGVLLDFKLRPNATLVALREMRGPLLSDAREEAVWQEAITTCHIHAASYDVRARQLSGGNQQKLALGKLLAIAPEILVLDEPTRGIDTGAKQQIYALIHQLAAAGRACVVISSELPEIIGLCHRVVVLAGRRVAAVLEGDEINEETIMHWASGLGQPSRAAAPAPALVS